MNLFDLLESYLADKYPVVDEILQVNFVKDQLSGQLIAGYSQNIQLIVPGEIVLVFLVIFSSLYHCELFNIKTVTDKSFLP